MWEWILGVDRSLFRAIHLKWRSDSLEVVLNSLNDARWGVALMLSMLLPLIPARRWKIVVPCLIGLLALGVSDGVCGMAKDVFQRNRPFAAGESTTAASNARTGSFPSAHAANAFAFATAMVWRIGRPALGFLGLAALTGYARVFAGDHFPLDVLGGAALGAICGAATCLLFQRVAREYQRCRLSGLFLVAALVSIPLRLLFIHYGPIDLSADEAHYWEWSRRLDLSYYSKGPLIAWVIAATSRIGRETALAVRFAAPFLNAGAALLLFQLTWNIYHDRVAASLAGLFLLWIPLFSVYGVALTTDSLMVFFWCLSLMQFWQAFQQHRPWQWYSTGLCVGFGFLAKYVVALFVPCAFLFLIATPEGRQRLKSPHPWLGVALSAAVTLPVWIWNAQHDWVTFRHTAGHAQLAAGLRFSALSCLEFIGSQAGLLTPLFGLVVFVVVYRECRRGLKMPIESRFLLCLSLPVYAFFFLKSIQGRVQGNWAMAAYPALFPLIAVHLKRGWPLAKPRRRLFIAASFLMVIGATLAVHSPLSQRMPEKLDPTFRLSGWKELGQLASRARAEMPSDTPCFLFSDNYQLSSELAFYAEGKPIAYCVNLGRRMNQYDLWSGLENRVGDNAIYVARGNAPIPPQIADAFDRHERVTASVVTRQGRTMEWTLFKLYRLRTAVFEQASHY